MPKFRVKGTGLVFEAPDKETAKMMADEYRADEAEREAKVMEMSGLERFGKAGLSGLEYAGRNIGNIVGLDKLSPTYADEAIQAQGERDEDLMRFGGLPAMSGRLLGEVGPTLPIGLGAPGVALKGLQLAKRGAQVAKRGLTPKKMPRSRSVKGGPRMNLTSRPRGLDRSVGRPAPTKAVLEAKPVQYAMEGATEGAILAGPEHRGKGAMMGAGIGGGFGVAGSAGRRLMRGPDLDPAVRKLMARGVNVTPGQADRGSLFHALEESGVSQAGYTGIPQARQSAQNAAFGEMAMDAAAPGFTGRPILDLSEQGVTANSVINKMNRQYNVAYGRIRDAAVEPHNVRAGRVINPRTNRPLTDELRDLPNEAKKDYRVTISDDELRLAQQGINKAASIIDNGKPTFKTFHKARSALRAEIAKRTKRGETDAAQVMREAEAEITDSINAILSPQDAAMLKNIDTQYGMFKIIEDAVYRAGPNDFPTQFQIGSAVKAAEKSKGVYARGGARMQDWSEMMNKAFGKPPVKTGYSGIVPAVGALAGLAYAGGDPTGGVAGALLPSLPAAFAARPGMIRNMYFGQSLGQRGLQRAMDQYQKRGGQRLNEALRAAMIAETQGEEF